MEEIEKPNSKRKLPPNTIMFCEKPWQIPSLALALLVLLTFAWGVHIVATFEESDFYEDAYDLSASEFLFRDMGGSNFLVVADAVAPGVVGIGAKGANTPPVASGAIVSPNGHVVTALHPLEGVPEISAHVRTPSGVKQYRAEIVKSLPSHNLALLKVLTPDRFLFFPLADTNSLQVGKKIMGIGFGQGGKLITKEGQVLHMNSTLAVGAMQLSHLLGTDAVYSWEQNGGPIVSPLGELVGINMSVIGAGGKIEGYAVPAHVIAADFGDVVTFRKPGKKPQAAQGAQGVNAGMPKGPTQGGMPMPGSSATWWAKARAQVMQDGPALGMNVAAPNNPMAQTAVPGNLAAASPGLVDHDHIGRTRIAGFVIGDIVGLAMLGIAVGVISGMMTMGGGILHVAGLMIFFGYGMHLIRPVAYLTNVFIFGASARRNHQHGLIMWDMVRSVAPWAAIGVVGGYFIGNSIGDRSVVVLLGLFAALMTAKGVHEIINGDQEEVLVRTDEEGKGPAVVHQDDEIDEILADEEGAGGKKKAAEAMKPEQVLLGLPAGLISGLLGISGGVVAVPLQRFLAGVSLQNAIANSSVVVFWASLAGAVVAFVHGVPAGLIEWQTPLTIALIMTPGAFIGGIVGARLMKQLPVVALRWFYTVIMAAVAVKMLFLS